MRNNKKGIIISIIFILIIATAVLAYLFLMTDVFKSSRELFAKYFVQGIEPLEEITQPQTALFYENLKNESKYESNTKINMIHSEGGEVSNPLNNLSMKLDIQKDNDQGYLYADTQVLYEDEAYLEAEIIKDQENYGIRFTDAVKQFVTVKKDENLETIANDIGIDINYLEMIINIIDGNDLEILEEQPVDMKNKILNIITTTISNGIFEKQRNSIITYNDVTTETNAYSVTLSSEQVKTMLIEIINNVKNESETLENLQITEQADEIIRKIDEELDIPIIKITVYEKNKTNIRTEIDIGTDEIVIENTQQDGEIKNKIIYKHINDEQIIQYNCEITNKNSDNQEEMQIDLNILVGETEYEMTLSNKMERVDNAITTNTIMSHTEGIITTSIELENKINIGSDFEKAESLTKGNYIPLNNMKEEKRKELINLLKQIVPQKVTERLGLLTSKFVGEEIPENSETEIENEETENTEIVEQMSQVEINKFNAKFEFYTGNQVSAENVKMLLDIVKNNVSGHSIMTLGDDENAKTSIMLYITKDSKKEESITQALEKIDNNKKYKVSISYNENNGLIKHITISEI